jgi:biopolymer transport protein ExbD
MDGEITILNVWPDGKLLIDGIEVLSADLAEIARKSEEAGSKFVIAGDKTVPYGVIANILELLREKGITTATLAIEGY